MQAAFGIRGLSKKDVIKLKIKKEMFVQSKLNVTSMQSNMPTSPSVDSLSVKVVRSHSGPISMQDINSALLSMEQVRTVADQSHEGYFYVTWFNTDQSHVDLAWQMTDE